ncbi:hypothetical protein AQI88_17980 [Streptomyces cellostaticus]|uniref:Acetoacetate decarboxylase n=1 Tax=Streptomyces cellostaticus TaxID=67285 RepID=A0A117PW36_9ACTN|nr:hypothetical protein [Streptomyces cellostaticus]KUM95195.1 hypothetical protein AQI88_17980 [Streptomyces cellostaticus]GHI02070.1 hypothetical protein Scel_03910 [Streptomyces cellostaticus]
MTCWVDFRQAGDSVGRELLVLLRVRGDGSSGLCLVEAWGDNAQSLTGGRALWGVPEQPGDLLLVGSTLTAHGGRGSMGRAGVRARLWPGTPDEDNADEGVFGIHHERLRMPGRRRLRTRLLQQPSGDSRETAHRVPVELEGQVRLAQTRLTVAPGGPLDYLARRRPLAAFSLRDFHGVIGALSSPDTG